MSALIKVLVVWWGGGWGTATDRTWWWGWAGWLVYDGAFSVSGWAISVTVWSGGSANNNWSNSVFSSITAIWGWKWWRDFGWSSAWNGGSGWWAEHHGGAIAWTWTVGQWHDGGTWYDSWVIWQPFTGWGGGGAWAAGSNGTSWWAGAWGVGVSYSISGSSVYYAGGGWGWAQNSTGGSGGNGGWGSGSTGGWTPWTANTGGGGGGGGSGGAWGSWGSGIVIISYPTWDITATGGTVTTIGWNTIHTFTSSWTFFSSPPFAPKASLGKFLGSGSSVTSVLLNFDSSDASDSSGNSNSWSPTNIVFGPWLNGATAATFDGSSSLISVADWSWIQTTWSLTFGATVVLDSFPSYWYAMYVAIRWSEVWQWSGVIQLSNSGWTTTFSAVASVGTSDIAINWTEALAIGKRYVCRWVYDATNNQFRFYVNGKKIGSSATSGALRSDANWIRLGMGFSGNYKLAGKLDEFLYERTAWDDSKVAKNYTHSIGRFATI